MDESGQAGTHRLHCLQASIAQMGRSVRQSPVTKALDEPEASMVPAGSISRHDGRDLRTTSPDMSGLPESALGSADIGVYHARLG